VERETEILRESRSSVADLLWKTRGPERVEKCCEVVRYRAAIELIGRLELESRIGFTQ